MKKACLGLFLLFVTGIVAAQNRETRNVDSFTRIAFRVPGKLHIRQGSPQKVELEGPRDVLKEIETEVSGGRLSIGKEWKFMDWGWDNDKVTVYVTVASLEGISVSGSGDAVAEGKWTAGDMRLNVSGSGSLTLDVTATGNLEADVSGSGDIDLKGSCSNFDSDVSGSGKVNVSLAIRERADFGVSGSGKISASGTAQEVKTSISGSGKVLASNLETERCEIRISGSGDVEINVKTDLDANISGSGSVSYRGNPNHVNSHASGSGSIRKIN